MWCKIAGVCTFCSRFFSHGRAESGLFVVPDWYCAEQCFITGLGIGVMPTHRSTPLIEQGLLIRKTLESKQQDSPCCIAWNNENMSPAIIWVLDYLGDTEKLQEEWLS